MCIAIGQLDSVWTLNIRKINVMLVCECFRQICVKRKTYPEIDDGNFKGALQTFEQGPALKIQMHYGISILSLFTS